MLQVKKPLILYLRLVAWQVNSVDNTRKFLQISHLLLHFSIEQLFSFIVLGNKDGDMSSFKFLFRLYVKLTVFSEKIWHISWLLCITSKCFLMMVLMLGSYALSSVIKLQGASFLPWNISDIIKLFFNLTKFIVSSCKIFLLLDDAFYKLVIRITNSS